MAENNRKIEEAQRKLVRKISFFLVNFFAYWMVVINFLGGGTSADGGRAKKNGWRETEIAKGAGQTFERRTEKDTGKE